MTSIHLEVVKKKEREKDMREADLKKAKMLASKVQKRNKEVSDEDFFSDSPQSAITLFRKTEQFYATTSLVSKGVAILLLASALAFYFIGMDRTAIMSAVLAFGLIPWGLIQSGKQSLIEKAALFEEKKYEEARKQKSRAERIISTSIEDTTLSIQRMMVEQVEFAESESELIAILKTIIFHLEQTKELIEVTYRDSVYYSFNIYSDTDVRAYSSVDALAHYEKAMLHIKVEIAHFEEALDYLENEQTEFFVSKFSELQKKYSKQEG